MNQKGGVGKSTLLKAVANFLSKEENKLAVIDADVQRSLKTTYEEDLSIYGEEGPFEVVARDLDQVIETVEILKAKTDIEHYLIDLPGNLNNDTLLEVFQYFDHYVTPFFYDRESFQSTIVFASVLKKINSGANIYFVPNRVKKTVRYSIKEKVDAALGEMGTVLPPIPDLVAYQRLRFFEIPEGIEREIGNLTYHLIK